MVALISVGLSLVIGSLRSVIFPLVLDNRQADALSFYNWLLSDGPIPAVLFMTFPASLGSQRK